MYMSRPTSVLPPPLPLSLSFRLLSSLLVALEDPLHESLIVNVAVRSLVPVLEREVTRRRRKRGRRRRQEGEEEEAGGGAAAGKGNGEGRGLRRRMGGEPEEETATRPRRALHDGARELEQTCPACCEFMQRMSVGVVITQSQSSSVRVVAITSDQDQATHIVPSLFSSLSAKLCSNDCKSGMFLMILA